jgi:elongation factor G
MPQAHSVDSSELAFKIAAMNAFWTGFMASKPAILEPIMRVEVSAPHEYQGTAVALINKRKGQLQGSETGDLFCTVQADVPLSQMFGFSTDLRSSTQGKGEFTMEYKEHQHVPTEQSKQLIKAFQDEKAKAQKK